MFTMRVFSRLSIQRHHGFSLLEILITLSLVVCMIHSFLQAQWFIQRQLSQYDQRFLHWLKISNQYELTNHDAQ